MKKAFIIILITGIIIFCLCFILSTIFVISNWDEIKKQVDEYYNNTTEEIIESDLTEPIIVDVKNENKYKYFDFKLGKISDGKNVGIVISPVKKVVNVKKGETSIQTFEVRNYTADLKTLNARIVDLEFSGECSAELANINQEDHSLADPSRISHHFREDPDGHIQISIITPISNNLEDGTYWYGLQLSESTESGNLTFQSEIIAQVIISVGEENRVKCLN